MENFDWSALLAVLIPVAVGGFALALGFFAGRVKELIRASENKVDDKAWNALVGALGEAGKIEEEEKPE